MNEKLHERFTTKKNYGPFVRPVRTHDSAVLLFMNLSLIQILDVDEKRQIIITNAWVNLDWKDHNFIWDPKEHGNVTSLLLPSENIWTPDLALYNNAGGDWDLASSSSTLVVVNYDGTVIWRPPIIFKSQCEINVEYFPFDMQNCSMKIGCWTHHGLLIDLRHTSQKARSQSSFDNCRSQIDHAIDLSMFTTDVQWDLIGVSARRNIEFYPCCIEPYLDITFYIILRRKPLFFGVNVICPCISISILTILVFYLPADSREKISLSISILIALTVFFLLVFEISPPTSLVVPLIVKFLLFTMVLIIFSTIATVVVLNIRTRSPDTHRISPWMRKIFIDTFPKILLIKRHEYIDTHVSVRFFPCKNTQRKRGVRSCFCIRSEWKYVAFVIDRLLLWVFIGTTAIGKLTFPFR
ncbi:unnamed protein product [Taenia asiatica]|uniref:Neur_chan_LBD domain-containing protein n=1 Tax=Taenia asiatica TaxID=60517 RepID=A0A3P6QZ77_TAEAS|nr:unnamed protein product [Taenia asiatica]